MEFGIVFFLDLSHSPLPYITLQRNNDVETVFLPLMRDGISRAIVLEKPLPFGASLHHTIFVSVKVESIVVSHDLYNMSGEIRPGSKIQSLKQHYW